MSGRKSQRKGRAGELELAAILQSCGYPVKPGQAVSYGNTPDLSGLPGVHIECKRVERLDLGAAMAQAVHDAEKFHDGAPAVFHRRNRQPWLVTMRLLDFLALYSRAEPDKSGKEVEHDHQPATSLNGPVDVQNAAGRRKGGGT